MMRTSLHRHAPHALRHRPVCDQSHQNVHPARQCVDQTHRIPTSLGCSMIRTLLLLAILLAGCLIPGVEQSAQAQIQSYSRQGKPPELGLDLLRQDPYDLIFFTPQSGGGWAMVTPLPFRDMPSRRDGKLEFEVMGLRPKKFGAKWTEIERIDFWEKRLEQETSDRIAGGDFTGAFPFLSILIRDYPTRPGLRNLRSDFLFKNAFQRAEKGERGEALALLEELHQYNPEYRQKEVINGISGTTSTLMRSLMEEKQYAIAQQLLVRLKKSYKAYNLESISRLENEFLQLAQEKRDQALKALEAKDYRLARTRAIESINLKPDIEGGEKLVSDIAKAYPMVRVGVLQAAREFDPVRLDSWAARRAGRLLYRNLFEIHGVLPEGGDYRFLFGDSELSADRKLLTLNLNLSKLEPPLDKLGIDFLADQLANRARPEQPEYYTPWAAAVDGIAINGPRRIDLTLRRPNVLPTCLLQLNVDGSWFGGEAGEPTNDYKLGEIKGEETRFKLTDIAKSNLSDPSKPQEIVEIHCSNAGDAVERLRRGDIDVLDQLFPADAARLRKNKDITVVPYPLPTVHMLIPCSDHPYIANDNFRRALVYGMDRENILNMLLGKEGADSAGCRVLSGPFPAGLDPQDPLGYAYDQDIKPHPFEPSLSRLLKQVAINMMEEEAKRNKETPPKLREIRLAHPADNMSRIACQTIADQWKLTGLEVELVELPPGKTMPDPDQADLCYVSTAIWEPILDARRVLGPEGLAKCEDQLLGLGLRRLEEALNWGEVRQRLLDLHFISHHELPVIPLWQMVDSYAYRKNLRGVGRNIISLYQNADSWRIEF